MTISFLQQLLALASGVLVGFSLGVVGGGGSVLAVPLMVYVVGVPAAHIAIGTSAVAVAVNAAINLLGHARRGNVRWACALVFAGAGVVGALMGSAVGKTIDGNKLLTLFAVVMFLIAVLMFRSRSHVGHSAVRISWSNFPVLSVLGLATGALSGFFGIGGGFLIVPALMWGTGMSILCAVGSSLVAVTAFGAATAVSYAWSDLIVWTIAGLFIAGGVVGGLLGGMLATRLASQRGKLNTLFAIVIMTVAVYMYVRSVGSL
ncbi:hypothetical protein ASC80_15125 [Afipia sp. Root123D2]|uniref:sulfite exporter TauE/SafE family protein n=1 Tax=Afipia sp. Root123D2 TaxID=1736436 RepID=UPI0006FDA3AE|nr:sulfite exporter TauE/SafE family protein [Afipia sp. Root123D2]KQW21403.1 hypothetical protein ASC80_15125 [Afipia sp. Root123D2]